MSASPARLVAAAKHLMRIEAAARDQANLNVPLHLLLTGEALVEATADPADTLITSLLLNRQFHAENRGDPLAIAERAIAAARRSAGAS